MPPHRHLKAADVHPAPYLGPLETRIHQSFVGAFSDARDAIRTGRSVVADSPQRTLDNIDNILLDAQVDFHPRVLDAYARTFGAGMQIGVEDLPIHKAAVDVDFQRNPKRRRYVGPRLTGLTRMPKPSPAHTFPAAPEHIVAAKSASLRLITSVNGGQRKKIRIIVQQSFTHGIDAEQTAARISNVVGLFPRWQTAVDNLYTNMLANGVPTRIANRRAADYADDLLDKRGLMIARTELLRSMNDGRLAGWYDLSKRGYLDAERSGKQWSAHEDDRICPECQYLGDPQGDGKGGLIVIGLATPFQTEYGPVLMPPAHPHCRCGATVIIVPPASQSTGNPQGDDDNNTSGDVASGSILADPDLQTLIQVVR